MIIILSPFSNIKNQRSLKALFTMFAIKALETRVHLFSLSLAEKPAWVDISNQVPVADDESLQFQNHVEGAEPEMLPFTMHGLPADLSEFDLVHISLDAIYQDLQNLITSCKDRGANKLSVSFPDNIASYEIAATNADIGFLSNIAAPIMEEVFTDDFPPSGDLLFEFRVNESVSIYQGNFVTNISAKDSKMKHVQKQRGIFEGSVVGQLTRGAHPIMAARYDANFRLPNDLDNGFAHSSPVLTMTGADNRVAINPQQVEKVSRVIRTMPEAQPFDYAGEKHPSVGHPHALNYFFAVTLQQFGFWDDDGIAYQRPMIAPLDGEQLKGSAYMAQAYFRKINKDPEFFTPAVQANLNRHDLLDVMRADDGTDPLPALALHLDLANRYGRDMLALGLTPVTILEMVNAEAKPLTAFIRLLDKISGYKEDPLRKKSNLLAMILSQRPERFLKMVEGESLLPVVDYHCMRACLRLGLIDILDDTLRDKLVARRFVNSDEEWSIRFAAYQIQAMVEELSGKTIGVVDWFFFNYMRGRCYEMTAPECSRCAANQVCLHYEQFFQPVIRTTHY